MKYHRFLLMLLLTPLLLVGCQGQSVRSPSAKSHAPEVPAKNRESADANVQLGMAYLQNGELAVALEKLQKAIKYNPYSSSAHSALGMLYQQTGELDLAEEHFRTSLKYDFNQGELHNAYGSFLCSQKRYTEAEKEMLIAAGNPYYKTPEIALTNLGICMRQSGDAKKSEDYIRQALDKNPMYSQALFQMANLFLGRQEYAKAELYYQRYQGKATLSAENLWLEYRIQAGLGDNRKAQIAGKSLLENFPDSRQALDYRERMLDEKK